MTSQSRLVLVTACALIDDRKRVLIAQRPEGKSLAGLWEFPGGKIEAGESPEDTLIRELCEELAIKIDAANLSAVTFASYRYPDFHLLMPLFVCRKWEGAPTPLENQAIAWVSMAELRREDSRYPMPPADAPLIPALANFLL
ncbi:MAG TPA: (deoxy)nucleoside triphosphate pyrophosphohydrolase [Micropepsaceae bacterium]|nr:(deoxy)nucleoside triphosphate pyrophosphohydrolase [Micropepsaceae bacterium]